MSPEAQRIAIGIACPRAVKKTVTVITGHGFDEDEIVLDPLHDLNAMHEAEKTLGDIPDEDCPQIIVSLHSRYAEKLVEICTGHPIEHQYCGGAGADECWSVAHATAAQRSEAFLRTIGKWDDSK